jgi:hypothetical protein
MPIVSARAAVAQQRHATKTIKPSVFLMIAPSSRAGPRSLLCDRAGLHRREAQVKV